MLRLRSLLFSLIVIAFAVSPISSRNALAQLYELRTYTTQDGKLDALNARFRDHTMDLFKKHGIESVGYWIPVDPEKSKNTLIYIIKHKDRDAAKASWKAFASDPEWKRVAKASGVGRLVKVDSVYMEPTDYSPHWDAEAENAEADADDVFELRIYKAAEGKLGKLDARFRDHTVDLFARHGIKSVGYWHPVDGPAANDTLIYIIKHDSPDAAKASWKAFLADPDWKAAAKASGVGRLAGLESVYMKPTDYSPIQ